MLYSYQRRSSDGRANHLPKRELFRLRLSSSTGLKQSMQPSFYLPQFGVCRTVLHFASLVQ